MGTISDKLMRIINTKEDIRKALISKGYDVPTSVPFKEYAKMILDLPCKVDSFPDIEGIVARYSASGLTNEQMAANPVWVDKTGNGHDLQLKNLAWAGMSGVGGYKYDFLSNDWSADVDQLSVVLSHKIVIINKRTSIQLVKSIRNELENTVNITLKITGLEANGSSFKIYDNVGSSHAQEYNKDGIYQINYTATEGASRIYFYVPGGNMGQLENPITIEQLPLYPGALVFDGVDDYGTCDNFPILTKEKGYTVVALRQYITRNEGPLGLVSNIENWFKDGAFLLEFREIAVNQFNRPISFGAVGKERDLPCVLTYQTSKSYNGVSIEAGNFTGTDVLHVGKLSPKLAGYCNAAIWELVFLDHDATEEELTKIKDYFVKTYPWLFPDQAWTVTGKTNEDEDRATIANITGNGNDLVLSNFGFAEGSGYGLYAQNYISYAITNRAVYTKTNSSIHVTKSITAGVNFTESARDVTIPSYRIKVTGIQSGQEMIYRGSNNTFLTNIPSDGIYVLPAVENGSNLGFQFVSYTGDCDITIEQIPEYKGYLLTDGVDDKAVSKQFKFGENFTVILDFKFPVKKISYCGFDLSSKVRIRNLQGSGVYVVLRGNKTLIPSNVVRAVTSEGKVYDENWNEYNIVSGNISSNYTMVNLGFDGSNQFAESAIKLAGIYSSTLSKDDCIKAYNYLQTIKSK
jgi:hypothetical protein